MQLVQRISSLRKPWEDFKRRRLHPFFGFKRVEIMFSRGEDWERSVLREQEGINAFNIPAETRPKWGFDPSLP